MIVYNLSVKIDAQIEDEWICWQKEEHIPEIMSTSLFSEYKMFRLIQQDSKDNITYVIQYFALSFENYNHYIKKFAPALRQKAFNKWGNRFIVFRTIMESVQ